MIEFSWLFSLVLIVPPNSMEITCQLFWSGKYLAVSVQWDNVYSVQDLFWSSWGASVRGALSSPMLVLLGKAYPYGESWIVFTCSPDTDTSTGYSCFTSLFCFCIWDWRQRQRWARGAHRAAGSWGVRSAALLLLTDPVLPECKHWKHSHGERMERKDSGVGGVPNITSDKLKGSSSAEPNRIFIVLSQQLDSVSSLRAEQNKISWKKHGLTDSFCINHQA